MNEEIYNLFRKTPIDILDEDYESGYFNVSVSKRWELIKPRKNNSTNIGLFNIWLVISNIKNTYNLSEEKANNYLVSICNNLIDKKLLRETPEYKRNNFKIVKNEVL